MNNFFSKQDLLDWAKHLVLDKGTDAAALAFLGAEAVADPRKLRKLDLASISSIHTTANGSVELKFIDKIKLIELLLSVEQSQDRPASDQLIDALDRAAGRIAAAPVPNTPRLDDDKGVDVP